MKYLQSLNLADNYHIGGTIPSAIGKLTSPTYLNLSDTSFTGQVPIGISYLVKLVILDISRTRYLDSYLNSYTKIPNLENVIGNLTNLREVYLDCVNISANGEEWGNAISSSLPNLQVLSMSFCNLNGEIPQSLTKLPSLSIIHLDRNDFSSSVPEFLATFKNLTTLTLCNCGLTGTFPGKILQMPTLTTLELSYNEGLQGMLPDFLQHSSLQTIVLLGTNFSGTLPKSIGNLKMMRKLDLSNCNFQGVIPSSVGSLNQLEYLDLSYNNFSGPFTSFSSAKNLRVLDLSNNKISGSITSTNWEGLLNLENLHLSKNSLNGYIPTSLFSAPSIQRIQMAENKFSGQLNEFESAPSSKLRVLDLRRNSLEGAVPKSIFEFRSLRSLYLSENKLNGTLDLIEILRPLTNLTHLDLSNNCLSIDTSGTPATTNSSFPQLEYLRLASCNLGALPEFLKTQARLEILDVSNNHIQGTVPRWIWNMSENLHNLNLSCNNFVELERPFPFSSVDVVDLHSNNIQGELPSLPSDGLLYLDCSSNNFTSINLDIGNNLSDASFFSLAKNDIYGTIPASLCNATFLQVLNLQDNHCKATIPDCLIARPQILYVLNARGNNLSGVIPDAFEKTCVLETLDLNGNSLRGPIPKSLAHCKELRVLDVGNNQMNDTFPCELTSLPNLHVLILRSNNFHGSIFCPKKNSMWPLLQILDLASNHFNGELTLQFILHWKLMIARINELQSEPDHLQHRAMFRIYYEDTVTVTFKGNDFKLQKILIIFTSIDLSDNALQGEIPQELGKLNALVVLNLSHNSLSGNVPSSFGNLSQIESLDLSYNALSGNIPQGLANLNFLQVLNLSFNKLDGPIPTSTQLQSFDASSYKGNQGLHGPPLTPTITSKHDPALTPAVPSNGSHWSSKSEVDCMLRGAEVGFPVGLTIFVGPLLYIKRWRQWYCYHLERLVMKIMGREDEARRRGGKRRRRQQQQRH